MGRVLSLLLGATSGLFCQAHAQADSKQVVINELMPSNINGIIDDRNDFPDSWVELYNAGDSEIDLKGWFLSNDKDDLVLWEIPLSCIIPSKRYKILYLDTESTGLHANFRLDIKGEELYLVEPDGTTIHDTSSKFDKQEPNNSFGRTTDGGDEWGWFLTPTPAGSNNESKAVDADQIVPSVSFNHEGGLYTSSITIELTPKKNADTFNEYIYYTTDGSEPTTQSNRYTNPFTIDTTTIVRARIIHADYLGRLSVTQSYIYPRRELTLPVISLTLDPDYLWNDTFGIYTEGTNGAYFSTDNTTGYFNWAQDWRRPVNVEYFIQGDNAINQVGEMRIHGGWGREKAQKSLAVYANKRFGTKRFAYSFFQEKTSLDDGYKSILLRNSGQDFNHTLMRDAFNQYIAAGKIDLDYQAYQPAIVFLNGAYWGIHNIRERSNDHHILSNYGTEDIDMLENFTELKCGDTENYDEFYSLITSENFTYEDLDQYLDIEESINYFILETFVGNRDWPNNNVVCWRKRDNGKWRWLIKDTDYSVTGNYNAFEWIYSKTKPLSTIIKACLSNEEFKDQFIDHYIVYLGDIFRKDITVALIDSFSTQIKTEMEYARPRWNLTVDNWNSDVASMKKEMQARPDYVYQHLQSFFQLGELIPVSISTTLESQEAKQGIIINNIPVYGNYYNGKFFSDRQMEISLADTPENQDFKYWSIQKTGMDDQITNLISTERTLSLCLDTTLQEVAIEAVINDSLPSFRFQDGILTLFSDITNTNYTMVQDLTSSLQPYVTAIDLTNVDYEADIALDTLFASLQANRLIYAKEELSGSNIICQSMAKEISLSDSLPFGCPTEFETEKVAFTLNAYKAADGTALSKGYYPLLLPFQVTEEELPGNLTILELSGDQFISATDIQANKPYICYWSNPDKEPTYTIECYNKKIHSSSETTSSEGSDYILSGSFVPTETSQKAYFINSQYYEGRNAGRLFVLEERPLEAFDVYLTDLTGILPDSFSIGGGTVDNEKIDISSDELQITSAKGGVRVHAAKEQVISIYTIDGKLFKQISLSEGNYFIPLPSDIYIINKQKVRI